MGGNQSRTRKLTVENTDPTSVIRVSEEVVQRIKNSQDNKQTDPPVFTQPPPPANPYIPAPLYHQPSPTSVQLKQDKLCELKKNDSYWQKRLKNAEADHKKINEIFENEYNKAIDEVGSKKKTESRARMLPPCQECKEAVKQCYKCHPDNPMVCADIVQAFQQCVDETRACLIANRG